MAFSFPKPGSAADRNLDRAHAEECLRRWRELPTRGERASAQRAEYKRTGGMATGSESMVLMADDSVALAYVGGRGGFRVIHNFGKAA